MTINELCTNTTKFDALSSPAGRVEVLWTVDEKCGRLNLLWKEHGRPLVQKPLWNTHDGISRSATGVVTLSYAPSGLIYTSDVPILSITGTST